MRAAVIADIHENYHNLTLFLQQIRGYGVDKIFFLGDFVNAGLALTLSEFEIPSHGIWGNNDGDRQAIMRVALSERSRLTMAAESFDIVKWGDRRLFLVHSPLFVNSLAKSGDFDAVFYGHNHRQHKERIGQCLVLNPGELSAHKTGSASFAIYDSETNDGEIITVQGNQLTVLTKEVKDFRKTIKFDL